MINSIQPRVTAPSFKGLIKDDKQAVNTKNVLEVSVSAKDKNHTTVNYALGNASYQSTFKVPFEEFVKAYQKAAASDTEVVDVRDVNSEPVKKDSKKPAIGPDNFIKVEPEKVWPGSV